MYYATVDHTLNTAMVVNYATTLGVWIAPEGSAKPTSCLADDRRIDHSSLADGHLVDAISAHLLYFPGMIRSFLHFMHSNAFAPVVREWFAFSSEWRNFSGALTYFLPHVPSKSPPFKISPARQGRYFQS